MEKEKREEEEGAKLEFDCISGDGEAVKTMPNFRFQGFCNCRSFYFTRKRFIHINIYIYIYIIYIYI